MRITEDRKGRLLETIWQLNDRFLAEDDDALGHMFSAVTELAEEAAAYERERIVAWLRDRACVWATDSETADAIEGIA